MTKGTEDQIAGALAVVVIPMLMVLLQVPLAFYHGWSYHSIWQLLLADHFAIDLGYSACVGIAFIVNYIVCYGRLGVPTRDYEGAQQFFAIVFALMFPVVMVLAAHVVGLIL